MKKIKQILILFLIISNTSFASSLDPLKNLLAEDQCVTSDFQEVIHSNLTQLENRFYYQMWKKFVLPDEVEAEIYITDHLPRESTCHGRAFAVQQQLYTHPDMSVIEATQQYAHKEATLFDMMRLVYTEIFTYIVRLDLMAKEGLIENRNFDPVKQQLRQDFHKHTGELLGSGEVVDSIESAITFSTGKRQVAEDFAAAVERASATGKRLTGYFNVISSDRVHTSVLLTLWEPDYSLIDADYPNLLVRSDHASGKYPNVKALIEGALNHVIANYLPTSLTPDQGFVQLIIYQKKTDTPASPLP